MDNWALAPLLVRITSPVSTPSWTLAGMAGTLPPLRRSTWPLTRVKRPTTEAWAVKGIASAINIKIITNNWIFCRMTSPPLGGAGVLPGLSRLKSNSCHSERSEEYRILLQREILHSAALRSE